MFKHLIQFLLPSVHASGFTDPLDGTSVETMLIFLIKFILGFVGLLALAGIVYGGIRIIISVGNEQGIAQGKKIVFWSIAGLVIIALSALIVNLVANAIGLKTP